MKSDARQTLADFLVREIGNGSERAWSKAHGLRPDDVRRARSGKVGITVDKLSDFAHALGVEAWQLLFPGFERNAPQFPTMSIEAIDAARELDKITDEAQRRRAYAAIIGVLEMVTGSPSGTTEPAAPPPSSADTKSARRPTV